VSDTGGVRHLSAPRRRKKWRFNEFAETVLGAALAYFYGLAVPRIPERMKKRPAAA
jgi:hypothetical protein